MGQAHLTSNRIPNNNLAYSSFGLSVAIEKGAERVRVAPKNDVEMRQFDPWPVFFKREWNRNWPFLVGFAVTGFIVTKFSLGLTDEDAKNSPFVQRHNRK